MIGAAGQSYFVTTFCYHGTMEHRANAGLIYLAHILGERCLVVRIGNSFLDFPQCTEHLSAMALSQPPAPPHGGTAYHLGSRKWTPYQAWCRWHPLQLQFCNRWAESCRYTYGRQFGSATSHLVMSLVFLWIHNLHYVHWVELLLTPL